MLDLPPCEICIAPFLTLYDVTFASPPMLLMINCLKISRFSVVWSTTTRPPQQFFSLFIYGPCCRNMCESLKFLYLIPNCFFKIHNLPVDFWLPPSTASLNEDSQFLYWTLANIQIALSSFAERIWKKKIC